MNRSQGGKSELTVPEQTAWQGPRLAVSMRDFGELPRSAELSLRNVSGAAELIVSCFQKQVS